MDAKDIMRAPLPDDALNRLKHKDVSTINLLNRMKHNAAPTNINVKEEVIGRRLPKLVRLKKRSCVSAEWIATRLCKQIADTNDTVRLTDEDREIKLKKLFKQANINIKFK